MTARTLALRFFLALLWLPFALSSCDQLDQFAPQDPPREELDKNLVKDGAAFRRAVKERNGGDGTRFEIVSVKREGTLLKVHVKGGCNEASYKFIWNGAIAESYPMQVSLVLVHEQVGDVCPAVLDKFLTLDLTKLLGENARLEDYVFHLHNGSKKQDATLNPNGVVSITYN